jgi:hypothetical protein
MRARFNRLIGLVILVARAEYRSPLYPPKGSERRARTAPLLTER